MTVFFIILSCVLWGAALLTLAGRQMLSPALSYLGLLALSFASPQWNALINNTILIGWLCMTVVVMLTVALQPEVMRRQTRGMWYMVAGGVVGLAVGLLGFTVAVALPLLYALMIIGTVAGIFLGFLLYTNTPDGRPVAPGSGNFFRYLLAKGFPTAITLMQPGIVLVLLIAMHNSAYAY